MDSLNDDNHPISVAAMYEMLESLIAIIIIKANGLLCAFDGIDTKKWL